jgi:hypothetical protein
MIEPDLYFLMRAATAFRRAFESIDLSDAPGFLPKFPCGCCSWATWFLGHFLKYECGLSPRRYHSASRDDDNHEWLVVEGIIVDITADQFDDCSDPIIVTRTSAWHEKWTNGKSADVKPIESYDVGTRFGEILPSEVYELIAQMVRTSLKR